MSGERNAMQLKKTFMPDRTRPNPHRRPHGKRQTTARSITFVRNWESSSPMGQLSFNLDSILEKSKDQGDSGESGHTSISQRISASPVPIAIASESPVARQLPQAHNEDIEEEEEEEQVLEDDFVPETQQSHREPIEFSDDNFVGNEVVKETPEPGQKKSRRKSRTPLRKRPVEESETDSSDSAADKGRRSSRGQVTLPNLFGRNKTNPGIKAAKTSEPLDEEIMPPPRKRSVVKANTSTLETSHGTVEGSSPPAGDLLSVIDEQPAALPRTNKKKSASKKLPRKQTRRQTTNTSVSGAQQDDVAAAETSSESDTIPPHSTPTVSTNNKRKSSSESENRQRRKSSRGLSTAPSLFGQVDNYRVESVSPTTPVPIVTNSTPGSFHIASTIPKSGHTSRVRARVQNIPNKASKPKKSVTETQNDVPASANDTTITQSGIEHAKEGCSVRMWQGEISKRGVSDVSDLDLILNRFEEIAWETRQRTESRPVKQALNMFAGTIQADLRNAIVNATCRQKSQSMLTKSQNILNKKRKQLLVAQRELSELQNVVGRLELVKHSSRSTEQIQDSS